MSDLKPKALEPYSFLSEEQGTLIPLNNWDYIDSQKRERGKSPAHANWMKRDYPAEGFDPVAWMTDKNKNIGFRPTHETVILDIDPRNGGTEGFAQLLKDMHIGDKEVNSWPHVITGSGGSHYYLRKDPDIPVKDSLEAYPGVEFKSFGRQVVAAGSKHPNGTLYAWDELGEEISGKLPLLPEQLARVIARPIVSHDTVTGAGDYDQEQLATMLDGLDPENYKDQEKWFTLMQACHHATAGDGRSEFIEWSTRDPDFADHAWQIGRRWDSLHAGKQGGITYRTLFKELNSVGKAGLIPRDNDPNDDFAALEEVQFKQVLKDGDKTGRDVREGKAEPTILDTMNQKFFKVEVGGGSGGQSRLFVGRFEKVPHPSNDNLVVCKYMTKEHFKAKLAHLKVALTPEKPPVPLSDIWWEWSKVRRYDGMIFDPSNKYKGNQFLNLWRGWPYEPKKGDWSLFRELIYDVLADGVPEVGDYIVNWMARMFQRPELPGEVGLIFPGAKGVGKSVFGNALVHMAGMNGMMVDAPDSLTGDFNYHLRDKIMLFADEAINPRDFESNSRLKALVTSHTLMFHEKGQTPFSDANRVHVVLATNDDWAISASHDERRWMISRPSTKYQNDAKFFGALDKQMRNGGYEALLFDMLHRDISKFNHRMYPSTSESLEQKLRSLDPFAKWVYEILEAGKPPVDPWEGDWLDDEDKIRMPVREVKDAFRYWCREHDIRAGTNEKLSVRVMLKRFREMLDYQVGKSSRPVPEEAGYEVDMMDCFVFPCLEDCRRGYSDWLKVDDMWDQLLDDPLSD